MVEAAGKSKEGGPVRSACCVGKLWFLLAVLVSLECTSKVASFHSASLGGVGGSWGRIHMMAGGGGKGLRGSGGGSGSTKRIRPQGDKRSQEISNPNKLRIIAGKARGKKIQSPDVYLRPMMAKVREALFSTLTYMGLFDVEDCAVLDTFSGSGSVGLEALSRGAARACFVDLAPDCTSTAMLNAVSCGFDGQAMSVTAKAQDVLLFPDRHGVEGPFDLISITPPYEEVLYTELIAAACNSPLVVEDTVLVIEYPIEMGSLPQILGDNKFFGLRNRKYGRTMLGIYVYRPTAQYDMRAEEFSSTFGADTKDVALWCVGVGVASGETADPGTED